MSAKSFKSVAEFEAKINAYLKECEETKGIITALGFSVFCGVNKDTIQVYSKKKGYREAYLKLKTKSEAQLVNGALDGKYPPTMAMFLLKNNYGYRDRSEVTKEDKPKEIIVRRLE